MAQTTVLSWITNTPANSSPPPKHEATPQPPKKKQKITPSNALEVAVAFRTRREREKRAQLTTYRTRVSAKLEKLPSLPLDILLEIFSHLHPMDLLNLSHTSKPLRSLLLHGSAVGVWREARRQIEYLPECPEDMSEPAYADLCFDSYCKDCRRARVVLDNIDWELRARLCNACAKKLLISDKEMEFTTDMKQLLPYSCREDTLYMRVTDVLNYKHQMHILDANGSTEGLESYREEKRRLKSVIDEHAIKCDDWACMMVENQAHTRAEIRRERKKAILGRLVELGYEDELNQMPIYQSSETKLHGITLIDDHRLVKIPRKLTDKSWNNIRDEMIEYMEKLKNYRLTRERAVLLRRRRATAADVWHTHRLAHPQALEDFDVYPSPADFCEFPAVKDIIEQDSEISVTGESFDDVLSSLHITIAEWQRTALLRLFRRTPMGRGDPPEFDRPLKDVRQALSLATTVFTCERPAGWKVHAGPVRNIDFRIALLYMDNTYQGMFYPEFLHHECNLVRHATWREGCSRVTDDRSLKLGSDFGSDLLRRPWSCDHLHFDVKASEVAATVVEACGLDASTASAQDMDKLDARLVCLKCTRGERCDGERTVDVRSWRNAIHHCLKVHWGDRTVSWQRLSDADAAKAMAIEAKKATSFATEYHRIVHQKINHAVWCCRHCFGTEFQPERMSMEKLRKHLHRMHDVDEDVDLQHVQRYCCRALDAPPIPSMTVQMIPEAS
ncbi:hypothetical protein PUNSTDRAFT_140607 [Punctularia strigosozonata HHB-11173 SS5]|uniref:uncharacterized protein n=1 Tax=Punctularia strigosozonata (strain HHB-11173) TaxID=741275 RepID=UPI0004418501|nr:uncharacterized protein PUNSTDRAFT_140607 [Punctularia strigosozonata HHB-11173 SS5]EIN14282.1 hypothetical protein PUNSTDRAFT_140607 [Punctularia strigosozonata HHB-11173 SS5]